MGFIGGNLEDIETSAGRLVESGALAVATGSDTHAAAMILSEAINEAMSRLVSTFEGIADALTTDIAQSHSVLAASDWQGQSRENALVLKERLQGQVNAVLTTATANLSTEKTTFITRAQALVDNIQTEFQRVMNEIDGEYTQLEIGRASCRERV